jgi:hypothetical protein
MSKERSIPKRLSGSEALDSIMHKVYERLRIHGHFHSHKAYQGYKARVTVEFAPAMSFSPPLTDDFEINFGLDLLPEGVEVGPGMKEVIDIPIAPPNQVREECGMDLPVQVEENGVPTERWVKPAQYKGKLKTNGKPRAANMGVPTAPGTSPIDADLADEYGINAPAN